MVVRILIVWIGAWGIREATGKETTLVVDVLDFNDQPGWTGPETFTVMQCTSPKPAAIEDPQGFTRPWTMRLVLNRYKETGF